MSGRDLLAALVVVVIWGTNFVAMKVGLQYLTPFQLGAARYLFAVLPLVLFLRRPPVAPKWMLLYGLFQGVGQFGFVFVSLKVGMSGALASVLLQTQVFFTALYGYALLGEKPGRPLLAGLFLAALGLVCFGMNYVGRAADAETTPLGFALVLAGAAMWAASNIVVRRAQQTSPGFDPLAFLVWSCTAPIVPFVLLSLALDPAATRWQWTAMPWAGWAAVAYLGWMATLVGYGLWTTLLKRHPVNKVAPFSLGVPVIGIAAGLVVLGESVTTWQWAGIALIVLALACVMFGGRLLNRA
ncbi:O-acetylserine/cysteine efflux transporter [Pseudoduganella flava]|uniref:EamA family transporter n=1 Tax=Pseudoduganella flava TaxID=871742 RepID=A0A562P6T9_9BURK|nr:EamA family transporter [Pseudoduganella flava]QGZ40036.1 EamA family transporter [Pseudoduganella flava]TWI40185.1 O-acetylserine/cysteine efflux transporter [Pseudoduganella flava]